MAATAIAVVLLIGAGACDAGPTPGPSDSTDTVSAGPTTTTTSVPVITSRTPISVSVTASVSSCPNNQLDGCYVRAGMSQFADAIIPMVRGFFSAYSSPGKIFYIGDGESQPEQCSDGRGQPAVGSTTSYEYCPTDRNIYLGQTALWNYYSKYGAIAPAIGLAHEWGHHLQQLAGIPEPTTPAGIVVLENQADCEAGAWTRSMQGRGLETTDLPKIDAFIPSLGSIEHPGRTHGTDVERVRAYHLGYTSGMKACNGYFPAYPLTS